MGKNFDIFSIIKRQPGSLFIVLRVHDFFEEALLLQKVYLTFAVARRIRALMNFYTVHLSFN